MNKLLRVSVAVVLLLGMAGGFAGCGLKSYEGFRYSPRDEGVVIRSYKEQSGRTVLTIPDTIDGRPVIGVENFGAFNTSGVKTVVIGKHVRDIGIWAFTNNSGLTEFRVDEENAQFSAVDGVLFSKDMKTLLYYPSKKGVTVDRGGRVTAKASYTVPDGVEILRSKAFYKCDNLETVVLPATVTRIEEGAFHKATALREITLPPNLEYIGKDAFAFCSNLTAMTVPARVTYIGEYAFFSCTGIQRLTMLCDKDAVTLGNRWYPTNNGMEIKELVIEWNAAS